MCKKVLKKFNKLVDQISEHATADGSRVRYGYFDLARNTYDILKIKTATPFLRLYKSGPQEQILEKQISAELEMFDEEVNYFILEAMDHNFGTEPLVRAQEQDL